MTCLQPYTDLSTLFPRHLRAADHEEFRSPAQIVLHYLGRLHEAIRHGLLHSFERDELAHLLAHAGAGPIQFSPSSTTNFYSPLYGRSNQLDEAASQVYTFNLVMIRRLVSTTTTYADA